MRASLRMWAAVTGHRGVEPKLDVALLHLPRPYTHPHARTHSSQERNRGSGPMQCNAMESETVRGIA